MSTTASLSSAPLGLRPASTPAHKGVDGAQRRSDSARGLSVLLLAAVVAAMVVVADRLISTWADGQLLLAWVFLWVVVFAGMALFADTARSIARRSVGPLDRWSQALAEARAETRLWEMARMDHRLMGELMAARTRAIDEQQEVPAAAPSAANADFSEALAPLGMDDARVQKASPTPSFWALWAAHRGRQALLYRYI